MALAGYIRGIGWSNREKLLEFVLVEFDQYSGLVFLRHALEEFNISRIVPISPFQGEFIHKNRETKRIQLPIVLAFAMTIHKCQGMTLSTAVIDLGTKELASGLTFVAISRVRRL